MRPFPLTVQRGGINRLRTKGAARADMLYDLVNGYITNAGSISPREGTRRSATLDSTTAGLMAMNGQFNVFSAALEPVPAGYIDNVLVDEGAPTVQFNPSPLVNPVYTVPSLLHFEDGNNSTSFVDSGQNPAVWTAIGNAKESTAQSVAGNGSLQFTNGTGQNCIQAPLFGTALDIFTGQPDFTVELWMYLSSFGSGQYRFLSYGWNTADGSGANTGLGFFLFISGNQVQVSGNTAAGQAFHGGGPVVSNQLVIGWNHIAMVRAGNYFRLFVNGQNRTLGSFVSDVFLQFPFLVPTAGSVVEFGSPINEGSTALVCYIDEIRVTKGRAVYGGEFFLPGVSSQAQFTLPFTTVPVFPYEVTNLLHFEDGGGSTAFTDTAGAVWTPHGAAQETTTLAKLGSGSGQFLGAGDYISLTVNENTFGDYTSSFDDCDFTFEMFVYPPQAEINDGLNHYFFDPGIADNNLGAVPSTLFVAFFVGTALKVLGQGSFGTVTYAGAFPAGNTWYHVAFVRRGDVLTTFVNGISQGSTNGFAQMASLAQSGGNTGTWYIGSSPRNSQTSVYVDEFRAIHGLACYVSNFNPPTAPYTLPGTIPNAVAKIWFAKPFMGFPYVVAQFANGDIKHFWLQNNGHWTPNTVEKTGAIVLPNVGITGLAYQAVRDMPPNPTWISDTQIAAGNVVEPTEYTGFAYRAVAVAGANPHTGASEPSWPTVAGGSIQEFGDFGVTSTAASSTQSSTTPAAQPLGTNITDRYGDAATLINTNTATSGNASTTAAASTAVTTWAPGVNYAPGAVVRPTTTQGAVINAIPNGDFEAGNDGNWTLSNADVTIQNAGGQYQGNYCVKFALNHDTQTCTMTNFGVVTPGQSVTATAYLNPNNNGPDMTMWLVLNWYNSSDVLISSTPTTTTVSNGYEGVGYRKVTITGSAPAGAAHVRVQIKSATGTSPSASFADLVSWNLEQPAATSNFLFEAVQSAPGVSGTTEPTWPTVSGNTVIDNQVTWKAIGTSIITWQAIPIMQTGVTEPVWPSTIGTTVVDGSTFVSSDGHSTNTNMSWKAISRSVPVPNPNIAAALGASHAFNADNDIVDFSAVVNPTDWTSENDAGYLPTGLNNYGDNPVKVLALYRSNLVVMNSGGYQMWQIDPDPQNMALLDAQPVGSIYTRSAQSVANDLLFLAEVGVRNLGTVGATANMQIGNTGQPVDPIVLARIQAALYDPLSLYYPARGQYWLFFGPEAIVLTINGAGIRSWSRYIFPDIITDWTLNAGALYLRTAGNLVWKVDQTALQDDVGGVPTNFSAVCQWPYLDMGSLGGNKALIGLDLVGDGQVTIQIAYREDDPTTFSDNAGFATSQNVTAPYTISIADTVPGTLIPIPVDAPSYSLILTFGPNQAWDWQAANFYFQDNRGRGF